MQVYAWYIWVKGYNGLPILDWIDNQEDIYKKPKKKKNG